MTDPPAPHPGATTYLNLPNWCACVCVVCVCVYVSLNIADCDGVISKTWSSCRKFRKVCYLYSSCTETLSRWARVNTHCAAMKRCKRLFGRFTIERTLGKKVSVLNSRAASLPVRYFRQRQRTSSFFSRHRTDVGRSREPLCST